ncbi:MAG: peptidase M3, partial [Candidatus Aminicenantales bacterium]
MRKSLFLLTVILFAAAGCAKKAVEPAAAFNPLIAEFTTPYGVPPFDRISPGDFMPAFDKGIAEQKAEIEAIVKNREAPTFANTLEELDRSGALLKRIGAVFSNLNSSNTNDQLQQIAKDVAPKLAKHADDIALDAGL